MIFFFRWKIRAADPAQSIEKTLSPKQRVIILDDARKIWKAMADKNNKDVKLPHDGYLKLFQLRNPSLQWCYPHDVLMIDEGQDMNPAMLDIFNKQKINKIIVGDPNQQIYMFRGAINALGSVEASSVYHLTQSFRFGPRIGYLANTCLEILQKVKTQTLVGGKKRDKIINRDEIKDVRDYKPIAVIGRTNIGLFQGMNFSLVFLV